MGSSHSHTRFALPRLNNDGPRLLAHSFGHAKLCPPLVVPTNEWESVRLCLRKVAPDLVLASTRSRLHAAPLLLLCSVRGCLAGRAPVRLAAFGRGGDLWSDEEEMHLTVSLRAVLDATGHNEQVSFVELDIPSAELHGDLPMQHDEDFVLVVVLMPVGRTDTLRDLKQAAIGLTHCVLGPELLQLGCCLP